MKLKSLIEDVAFYATLLELFFIFIIIILILSLQFPNGQLTLIGWLTIGAVSFIALIIICIIKKPNTIKGFLRLCFYCVGFFHLILSNAIFYYTLKAEKESVLSPIIIIGKKIQHSNIHMDYLAIEFKRNSFYPTAFKYDLIKMRLDSNPDLFQIGHSIIAKIKQSKFAVCVTSITLNNGKQITVPQYTIFGFDISDQIF